MSAPRLSEADVEALTSHVLDALHAAHHRPGNITMLDLAQSVAEVLASDWLAARDAEREREVEGQRRRAERLKRRSVRSERALADRDAAIEALADDWEACDEHGNPLRDGSFGEAADDLRALLPRDDAAGAGGAP